MPPAVRAGLAAARVTARVRGIQARCRPPAPWARTGRQRPQQGAHECALESGSRWGRRAAARGVALSGGTGRVGRGGGGGDYGETDGRALQIVGRAELRRGVSERLGTSQAAMTAAAADATVGPPPAAGLDKPAVLTEKLVLHKARCAALSAVRNLNLWGSGLSDVSLVSSLPNAEVISLSVNKVTSLRPFADCVRLQELYLRKNHVADLGELLHLRGLKRLSVLWLADNPCAEDKGYRSAVLRLLPRLTKLDNMDVTKEERRAAEGVALPASVVAALEESEAAERTEAVAGEQGAGTAPRPAQTVRTKAPATKVRASRPAWRCTHARRLFTSRPQPPQQLTLARARECTRNVFRRLGRLPHLRMCCTQ